LIGLPGSGKSVVAPLLAARLGCSWADLDERIARAAGVAVPELLRREGEARFRAVEEEALRAALRGATEARGGAGAADGADAPRPETAASRPGLVLACGGGVVARPESSALLRQQAFVVWLRVAPETAAARIGRAGAAERPLLDGAGSVAMRIEALLRRRAPLYAAVAHAAVETEGRTAEAVAGEVQRAWEERAERWGTSGS
jgi:shikimate kinase